MVAQLSTGQLCGWRSRTRLTQALFPAQSHWPASATRGGERGGDRGGGAAAPTHLDAALQTPPRGACRGRDWEGECEGTASPGPPHEAAGGAAPLRTHTEACHTEAGFRLLCCGEEAATPSLLGSAPCRVFWTRLSHTLSQFTGNYRDE